MMMMMMIYDGKISGTSIENRKTLLFFKYWSIIVIIIIKTGLQVKLWTETFNHWGLGDRIQSKIFNPTFYMIYNSTGYIIPHDINSMRYIVVFNSAGHIQNKNYI